MSKQTVKLWILHGRLVREVNFKLSLHQFFSANLSKWDLLTKGRNFKAFKSLIHSSAVFGSIEIRDRILKVWIFSFSLTSGPTVLYTTLFISMHPIQYFFSGLWSHNISFVSLTDAKWEKYYMKSVLEIRYWILVQASTTKKCYLLTVTMILHQTAPGETHAVHSQIHFPFWHLCLGNKNCLQAKSALSKTHNLGRMFKILWRNERSSCKLDFSVRVLLSGKEYLHVILQLLQHTKDHPCFRHIFSCIDDQHWVMSYVNETSKTTGQM